MTHALRRSAAQTGSVVRRGRSSALPLPVILALVFCLCTLPAALAESTAAKRAAARAQFERAEKQRTALQGKPKKARTLAEYTRVVTSFRRVYLITPHAGEAPAAMLAAAELYHDMGRSFDEKYYQSAIEAYRSLLREYPTSRHRDDALLTIAEIQKDDIGDFDKAAETFREFLKLHPRSEKAADAREALAEIAQAREKQQKAATREKLGEQEEKERKLPQVTRIRTWNAVNYTRIVIDVEDEIKYQAARIFNPDRIYFDLQRTKLSSTLAGKNLDVPGGYLRSIRVAQNQAGVVRVVLDVDNAKDYSVFLLPNPYRLVIDVYGPQATTAKSTTPAEDEKAAAPETKLEKTEKSVAANTEPVAPQLAKPAPAPMPPPAAKSTRGRSASSTRQPAALTPPPVPQPTHTGQHSLTRALGLKIGRIVIDPGHGGHDTGTIGPTGLMEKDLCLDVARRLGKIIQQRLPGAEVVYTREDDTFVPLENRTAIANQANADLFISIHANSSHDHKARGVETYYLNFSGSEDAMEVAARENALSQNSIHELQDLIKKIARNEKIEESRELAADIQGSLSKRLQRFTRMLKDRGVRKAPFVVLIGANMPSVLSEISFLSNPADEQMLKKPEHRQRVAEGLYHGVESYLQSINSLTSNLPKPALGSQYSQ
jgi:N-acetylmuramoyl-L-alanine amidase